MTRAILICALWSAVAEADVVDARETGRRYQTLMESADADALWPQLSSGMQQVFGGTKESMKRSLDENRARNGVEVHLAEESVQYLPDGYKYLRRAMFERGYVQYTWWFDRDGLIRGMLHITAPPDELAGEAPTKFGGYETKSELHLPFRGTWRIIWGGRTLRENRHAETIDQRFAYDIDAVKNGKTHSGDGKRNEDYFTFGQPIIAPAAGTIVEAVDGLDDNPPGKLAAAKPCGNHVIIDLGQSELAFLCHLQKGTVAVKSGVTVARGQLLGKAGNSGNSSEPHLHFHLQTTPRQNDGEGLPAQFNGYTADGKNVSRGEPTRGQLVSPAD